jgi:hypothetical protein
MSSISSVSYVVRLRENLDVQAADDIVIVQKPIGGGLHFVPDLSQRAGQYTLARTSIDCGFEWA